LRVLLLHVSPMALTTPDASVCWRRALGGKKAMAAHAFSALPAAEGIVGLAWSRQSLCRSVEQGGLAGPSVARCKRCLNVLEGRPNGRPRSAFAVPSIRSLASHHRLAVQLQSLAEPAAMPDIDEVNWCRALGSRRVTAHGFRRISDALGELSWGTRSVCGTAERGELAGGAVPQCKRCLDGLGERQMPNPNL
jgi:hypothetical protein